MKREEKNQIQRGKILESAMREFARDGYAAASMNNLCATGGISKGIVYHYFADKDSLYLACLRACFSRVREATSAISLEDSDGPESGLRAYFEGREAFFAANPECASLFCSAMSNPPEHLREQIVREKSDLDQTSLEILTRLLDGVRLRKGIQVEDVVGEFHAYQDYFNLRVRALSPGERERACRLSMDILLYGVIEREEA